MQQNKNTQNLITVNKRIRRVLLDHDNYPNDIEYLIKSIKPSLFAQNQTIESTIFEKLKLDYKKCANLNWQEQLELFSKYSTPLNQLFDGLMIIDKNQEIKDNRLQLLKAIRLMILNVADISLI